MSDRSEEEEKELQKAINALRAKTFAKAHKQEKARLPQELLDAANRAIEEGFKAQNLSGMERPRAPATKSSGAIKEAVEQGRSSPSSKPPGSPLMLTPPVEEWTEEDHEFARLALAALGIEPSPVQPPSDAQILKTVADVDGEELARLILAARGRGV